MERRGVYLAVSVVAPWAAIVGAGAWAAVVSRELWHLASGGGAIGLAVACGRVAYGTPGQQPGWSRARLLGYASRAGPWRFLSGARTSNAASSRRRQKPSMARSNASLPGAGTTGCGTALIAFRTRSGWTPDPTTASSRAWVCTSSAVTTPVSLPTASTICRWSTVRLRRLVCVSVLRRRGDAVSKEPRLL